MESIQYRTSCNCADAAILNDKTLLSSLLETMMTARKFEEKLLELYELGLIYGTIHLGIGEEAASIGTTAVLVPEDYMVATHRGHNQSIGKGCDVKAMMAEMLGKEAGSSKGRGGSMHIADLSKGALGTNGIVGANAPIACGAAMTIKQKGLKNVSAAFFGDGASNQGAVHEAMNLASAWKLPMMFCLFNNSYAMSTHISTTVGETDLTKRAAAYGMKAFECDGNDILQVYMTAKKAREYAVLHGPVLIVEHTYRTSAHSKSDTNLYRTEEEIAIWKEHNPISRFTNFLLENKLFTSDEIRSADEKTAALITEAYNWATACPEPDADDATRYVYA